MTFHTQVSIYYDIELANVLYFTDIRNVNFEDWLALFCHCLWLVGKAHFPLADLEVIGRQSAGNRQVYPLHSLIMADKAADCRPYYKPTHGSFSPISTHWLADTQKKYRVGRPVTTSSIWQGEGLASKTLQLEDPSGATWHMPALNLSRSDSPFSLQVAII